MTRRRSDSGHQETSASLLTAQRPFIETRRISRTLFFFPIGVDSTQRIVTVNLATRSIQQVIILAPFSKKQQIGRVNYGFCPSK